MIRRAIFVSAFLFSLGAFGFEVGGYSTEGWDKEILAENEYLHADYVSEKREPGKKCASVTGYRFVGDAVLTKVDVLPVANSNNAMEVVADLAKLEAAVGARYAADRTYCLGVKLKTAAGADSLHIRTRIDIADDSLSTIQLKVLETSFTAIHFVHPLPSFYAELMTDLVNLNLEKLWSSRLGDWISAKITEEIRKRLGENV